MRKIFISLLILISVAIAQIDTLDLLSYFPLQTGNKWYYEIIHISERYDTSYGISMVMGDTLLPNGRRYYKFGNYGDFYRIDTTNLDVYKYSLPYSSCQDSEYVIFDLDPIVSISDSFYRCDSTVIYRVTGYGQIGLIQDSASYIDFSWNDGVQRYISLSKYIGISEDIIDECGVMWSKLIGAEINGVLYGNTLSIESEHIRPFDYLLLKSYPNPFNPSTTIIYNIPYSCNVEMTIYDILGKHVATLISSNLNQGIYRTEWSGKDYRGKITPSGLYLLVINLNGIQSGSTKLLKMK